MWRGYKVSANAQVFVWLLQSSGRKVMCVCVYVCVLVYVWLGSEGSQIYGPMLVSICIALWLCRERDCGNSASAEVVETHLCALLQKANRALCIGRILIGWKLKQKGTTEEEPWNGTLSARSSSNMVTVVFSVAGANKRPTMAQTWAHVAQIYWSTFHTVSTLPLGDS